MSDSLQKNNGPRDGQSGFNYIPHNAPEAENIASNGLDPKKLISILLRYKWIVLLFLIAGATGAWVYADYITPVYESEGTLLINPNASSNDELSQIVSQTTGYGTSSTLENELQILQSREFSRQIARKLIAEDSAGINKFPLLWTQEDSGKIYRTSEEVVANRIRNNIEFRQPKEESDIVSVSFQSSSPQEAAEVVNKAMEIYVDKSTQQNRQAAEATTEFLKKEKEKTKAKLEAAEEKLRKYMDATGIVQENQQATSMVTQRVNVESELQKVNLELDAVNQSISKYEKQLDKIKPGLSEQFSEAIGPRIKNLQEKLADYERERSLIITKNPGVLKRNPVPPQLKYVDGQIEDLKKEIKSLSNKLFTSDNEFMGMDSEDRAKRVSEIQSHLVELRIQKNQYITQKDTLAQQKESLDVNFNSLPKGMIELAKLKRDVRINEELYMNVSKKYADMSVWKQSQFGFGRIIDRGEVPAVPVSPNKKILLILGLMLGGFFSAVYIAISDFMDNTIKSVDQLRSRYLPDHSLSVVPTFEKISKRNRKAFVIGEGKIPDEIVLYQDRSSLASESIRRLKNNIIYQYGETPPKTIAVTSPEKGDGKSTIVANLGITFAEDGYNTIVIEADFRRPKLQTYFGLNNKEGLSDYLYGKLPFQQLIQDSDSKGLKIITAGKETQKPDMIGNSKQFKQFLEKMEEMFDVIILDTPPFGILSDSTALLKKTEATLIVARYRKTHQGMLFRTIEELSRIQANITGIVLNDFDHKKETGHYYGSGYYNALYTNYEIYSK